MYFVPLAQLFFSLFFYPDRDGFDLDVDSLYMWALSLKCLGKTDVALKKIEEAIDNSKRKAKMVRKYTSTIRT